jgi:predicted dehydrogenase|tara:strand:- start:1966 stop:2916 length:951 start_codon:yes stop_codon:yes gene_type:complete
MSTQSLWLIGASTMAEDYALVLAALKQPIEIIGRSEKSALLFEKATGKKVRTGGLKANLKKDVAPEVAIVAVGIEQLASVTEDLIRAGTKRILLEKPGALNFKEIYSLNSLANKKQAEVFIAYNRRFYHSVQQLQNFISEDGGVLSINFEFTEWAHTIKPLKKSLGVKENWLIGNSSHVIDLVFHLCGKPKDWKCWQRGSLDWHPASARFCGSGITDKGVMFSYLSDWQAPGRWGLELMTAKRRFILRPMEQLQVIRLGSILVESVKPTNQIDKDFKPGLFQQTKNFLERKDSLFCSLSEQSENIKTYSKMAGYSD